MAVYIIVIVLVALLLLAAYRSLGGATSTAADTVTLLRQLQSQVRAAVAESSPGTDAPVAPSPGKRGDAAGRAVAAAQHTLDSLPSAGELSEDEAAVRALLEAAVEDVAWAARMAKPGARSPGLVAAAALLAAHASDCCDAAEDLLGRSAAPPGREPLDGG